MLVSAMPVTTSWGGWYQWIGECGSVDPRNKLPVVYGKIRNPHNIVDLKFCIPLTRGKSYLCFMADNKISNLNALLKAIRLQIELLQVSLRAHPNDKELRKLLNEAKNQETVILTKLSQWTLN